MQDIYRTTCETCFGLVLSGVLFDGNLIKSGEIQERFIATVLPEKVSRIKKQSQN